MNNPHSLSAYSYAPFVVQLSDGAKSQSKTFPELSQEKKKSEKRKHSNVYVTIVINLLAHSINVNTAEEKHKQDTTTTEKNMLKWAAQKKRILNFVQGNAVENAWDENRKKNVIKLNCSLSARMARGWFYKWRR